MLPESSSSQGFDRTAGIEPVLDPVTFQLLLSIQPNASVFSVYILLSVQPTASTLRVKYYFTRSTHAAATVTPSPPLLLHLRVELQNAMLSLLPLLPSHPLCTPPRPLKAFVYPSLKYCGVFEKLCTPLWHLRLFVHPPACDPAQRPLAPPPPLQRLQPSLQHAAEHGLQGL